VTQQRFTLVSFHAHPDDEALLTGGTLARAAAVGQLRSAELQRSAAALGCHRVIELGYPDSGMRAEHAGFAALAPGGPAERLAAILREEGADVLTTYDPRGGYGHPDHIQVHRVGQLAALLAGTPVVLEATVDRGPLVRAARLVHWTGLAPVDFSPAAMGAAYSESAEITHRVNVRGFWRQKKESMRAHATQAAGGDSQRTLAFCVRLPGLLYRVVFGTEWFIERGGAGSTGQPGPVAGSRSSDVFSSLR
jgi:LmbE family N-acetylglucosaminyl deacetylase